jgi:hypothetical protein
MKNTIVKSKPIIKRNGQSYTIRLPHYMLQDFERLLKSSMTCTDILHIEKITLQQLYFRIYRKLTIAKNPHYFVFKIMPSELLALAAYPETFDYGFNAELQEHKENLEHIINFNTVL